MQGWLDGDVRMVLATAFGLVALLGVEGWLAARGVRWYHRLGFPAGVQPVPLDRAPSGQGASHGVAWRVVGHEVLFRAQGTGAPRGLHGSAALRSDRHGRVHLDVRWAPAWTPLVALAWLSTLGVARGEGPVLVPVAVTLGFALLATHARVATAVVAGLVSSLRAAEPTAQGQGGRPS